MKWFRTHPYLSAIIGSALLLFGGFFIVKGRAPVTPNTSTATWGGTGSGFLNTLGSSAPADTELRTGLYQAVQSGPPFSYISPAGSETTTNQAQSASTLDEIIALLTNSGAQTNTVVGKDYSQLLETYSFIPRGLIATTTLSQNLTPTQQALQEYGNRAGRYVRSFENTNRNMARVLKDQFEDPQNPQKNQALLSLASDMIEVGRLLEEIGAPTQAESANVRLAQSYRDMGTRLSQIPEAKTSVGLLNAILAYNAAADAFLESYGALVTLFSTAEVTFDQYEPGGVFMFSGTGRSGF